MRKLAAKLLVSVVLTACLFAHEDPASVADSLTHDIEHFLIDHKGKELSSDKQDELADLYFLRANELLAIGKKKKAYTDLLKYTKLKPKDYIGWSELASVESDIKKQSEYLEKALKLTSSDNEKSYALYALAEYSYKTEQYQQALDYCSQAITLSEENQITQLLFKEHLMWRLGQLDQRVNFLAKVMKENSSHVLKHTWIDAKIDARQSADVKQVIDKEMKDSRFKSSWLIRASRCELEGSLQAKEYAQAAIDEILPRLHPERPDLTLQVDLVRAYSFLNDKESNKKAQQYFDHLNSLNYNQWELAELTELLKARKN